MNTPISSATQSAAAAEFAAFWSGKGYEKGQTQPFWLHLLRVLGVESPESFIEFEDAAHMDETHGFIDAYIPSTHVLIEQKSLGRDLRAAIKQSDGTLLTPFQQARRYAATLPYSLRPRWIVACNFAEFHVYDMENPNAEPEAVRLADLGSELYRLHFLVNAASDRVAREMAVSIEAGGLVGRLYDALLARYGDTTPETLHALNVLCVRLVFCLYAEDAGIFADDQFHDWLAAIPTHRLRQALLDLFDTLDKPAAARSRFLDPGLAAFPYVNGSLFSGPVEIPQFTEELREILLRRASLGFDWAEISPTIFGAVFESTLNPETRRSGGMHYTSIENIHKVIDPLFLDDLRAELNAILEAIPPVENLKLAKGGREYSWQMPRDVRARLLAFQDKLATLTFLDPACGSGNFLTETYLSLRRMENEVIAALLVGPQGRLAATENDIAVKVSIAQFHGIEINDFAVSVAKTALWIAESQMLAQTSGLLHHDLDFLPLKSYAGIREGNALHMDWGESLNSHGGAEARRGFDYIIGNPPFVGAMWMKGEKRKDVELVFPECAKVGEIDYVSGWYAKAAKLIQGTSTKCAFVSTNSITQGQQVSLLWKPLFVRFGLHIDFAYRTFRWDSESTQKAAVHCVIVGFSALPEPDTPKKLFLEDQRFILAKHINGYLLDADNVYVDGFKTPLSGQPPMHMGVMARDGGFLLMSEEERRDYETREPRGMQFVHRYMMGKEFINNIPRYCFWLLGADPSEIRRCPLLLERIENVRQSRLASPAKETQKLAATPSLFAQLAQPTKPFLAFPSVSSENRRYIPIGFLTPDIIVGNKLYVVEDVGLYHFGVLTSNVHNAWMRAVCGRMKSDYNYSNTIVYNTFPWPDLRASASPREQIERTAQAILDARANYPHASLADLYDPLTMPPDLLRAHQANDRAVMTAYGFDVKMTESDCVAELFKLYERLATGA